MVPTIVTQLFVLIYIKCLDWCMVLSKDQYLLVVFIPPVAFNRSWKNANSQDAEASEITTKALEDFLKLKVSLNSSLLPTYY